MSQERTSIYRKFRLAACGLGGLLYGIDVGLIASALPYIKATCGFTADQLSSVVAAVLLGNIPGTILAASVAERFGRVMAIRAAAIVFTAAVPFICLSGGAYWPMLVGRILQGVGCGLVAIAGPMYLAECLPAESRGKGTGMFQLVLVIGLFVASIVGMGVAAFFGDASSSSVSPAAKNIAWQSIFWFSAVPGAALVVASFFLRESPRWLARRGRRAEACAALRIDYPEAEAARQLAAIEVSLGGDGAVNAPAAGTVWRHRYLAPFALAFLIAVFVQASGINSVLNYSVTIFDRAGLPGVWANGADAAIKAANFLMTIVACALVDRKGRKFLLMLGSAGLVLGLGAVGAVFWSMDAFGLAPSSATGAITLAAFILFVSSFAVGPGVCVHLALSELIPTRIRATGMLVCVMASMSVSYAIARAFLPWAEACGYQGVFFTLGGAMVLFFLVVAYAMPETKGRTLEEIERHFQGKEQK